MKLKELTKTFMMITNNKKLRLQVYTKIFQREKQEIFSTTKMKIKCFYLLLLSVIIMRCPAWQSASRMPCQAGCWDMYHTQPYPSHDLKVHTHLNSLTFR